MAEAVVSVFTEQLVSTIRLELEQKVTLVVDVRKEVESLSTTFRSIQAVLQDAEKQQVTSAAVKLWLEELKNLAYNADDVLDEWKTRILISQSQTATLANRVLSYLSSPCSCFYPVVVRYDIAHRIKLIRERLDEVARDKDQFKLKENHSPQERPPRPRLLTSSIADVSKIYGRELDKQIILSRLLGEGSQEDIHAPVPIISIVGTGGFGKTTLAQLVFKEETVVNTFELKMWICVSEPFERERLAKEIIQQAGGNANNVVGWEDLHQALCASVKGKQFLLVLDDVWSEDPEDWNPLQLSLDGGAPGSRIIVTTRSENVATMVGSTCTHRLGQLSEDHCWSLFQQIAFLGRSLEERGKLEEIGIEITKKCKGVPLAVKTIAGLMRSKPTKQDWRNVLASDTWRAEHLEKGFLPALLLSYHALPSNVKLCFTYCATYSKDTIMVKDELVKLWMAQGYLDSDGGEDLEMIGGEYFNDLAMRSFFQDFEKDSSGSIVRCKMHDLVHDLAQFLMKSECLFCQDTDKEININCNKVRHMTYSSENHSMIYKFKNLRTLVLLWEPTEVLRAPQLHQLTCLRALHLSCLGLGELPGGLDGLLHLRYLDMSNNDIVKLPRNICNLYNLQTLKLNRCRNIRRLPEEIGSLVNLRHLEMEGTYGLKYIPASIGRLSQLRTLSKFIVSGNNTGGCAVGELGNMNYLSGHLSILALRHVRHANEAKSAELQKKTNINSLELWFGGSYKEIEEASSEEIKRMESVLEGLEPHNNLETLRIYGYPGLAFPRWMSSEASSSLSNIVKLQLEHCNRCTILPTGLGKLRYLEELVICLKSVKQLGPDFCGGAGVAAGASDEEDTTDFPKLKCLQLEMEELEDWVMIPTSSKFKNKFMPCLRELQLLYCSKLKSLPALGRLGSLERISIYDLRSLEAIRIEDLASMESVGADKDSNSGIILPRLREVSIGNCPKLKTLPALGRLGSLEKIIIYDLRSLQLKSLESLFLSGLDAVKHVRSEIFGVPNSDGTNGELSAATVVVFPSLNYLYLRDFKEWGAENEETTTGGVSMFPSLVYLKIAECEKLKVVPHYLFPHSLRDLCIQDCPQLAGVQQHCLPPLLESLTLSGDVGVLSRSLLPIFTHNSNYPNLKEFRIWYSRQSSLPQGLNQLTSLQELRFDSCELLDFKPEEELRHFPMLQSLYIDKCPVLTKRCRRANWSISSLSNILEVYVNSEKIKSRN